MSDHRNALACAAASLWSPIIYWRVMSYPVPRQPCTVGSTAPSHMCPWLHRQTHAVTLLHEDWFSRRCNDHEPSHVNVTGYSCCARQHLLHGRRQVSLRWCQSKMREANPQQVIPAAPEYVSSTATGKSSSSEAITPVRPLARSALQNTSLLTTSSFFWSSPCAWQQAASQLRGSRAPGGGRP